MDDEYDEISESHYAEALVDDDLVEDEEASIHAVLQENPAILIADEVIKVDDEEATQVVVGQPLEDENEAAIVA